MNTIKKADKNNDTNVRVLEIEQAMLGPSFWSDPQKAQSMIKELQELKDAQIGVGKYDRGNALVTIMSGAGGDDAEDFSRMLFEMYGKYADQKSWHLNRLDENQNSHGGYRSITFEVAGKDAYGNLQHENGVHRLVRLSPFNSQNKRQTSFSLVEVVPVIDEKPKDIDLPPRDLEIEFSRSGGPGGQNVNKRETAVRIVHIPSGLSVRSTAQRTQEANKEKAMQILMGKVYTALQEERKKDADAMKISKKVKIEWGSQIRSYVLHPYQMVKDHRTNTEVRNADKVLGGDIQLFIDAQRVDNSH